MLIVSFEYDGDICQTFSLCGYCKNGIKTQPGRCIKIINEKIISKFTDPYKPLTYCASCVHDKIKDYSKIKIGMYVRENIYLRYVFEK